MPFCTISAILSKHKLLFLWFSNINLLLAHDAILILQSIASGIYIIKICNLMVISIGWCGELQETWCRIMIRHPAIACSLLANWHIWFCFLSTIAASVEKFSATNAAAKNPPFLPWDMNMMFESVISAMRLSLMKSKFQKVCNGKWVTD